MKNTIRNLSVLAVIAFGLMSIGCSSEWRTGNANLTSDQVLDMLAEASSANTSSSGNAMASATALQSVSGTSIFFASVPDGVGQTPSELLAVDNYDFLNGATITPDAATKARVFFLDSPHTGEGGLVIGVAGADGTFQYFAFYGTDRVDGDTFTADLFDDSSNHLVLTSTDVDGDDLNAVIQLRMNYNGQDIGKLTTLMGYGPLQ